MNCAAQASAPMSVGSQVATLVRLVVTAAFASVSAASRYCSASSGETVSAAALLLKPNATSSVGNWLAIVVGVPSRSLTVLLYSRRVTRRTTCGPGSTLLAQSPFVAAAPDPALPAPAEPTASALAATAPVHAQSVTAQTVPASESNRIMTKPPCGQTVPRCVEVRRTRNVPHHA